MQNTTERLVYECCALQCQNLRAREECCAPTRTFTDRAADRRARPGVRQGCRAAAARRRPASRAAATSEGEQPETSAADQPGPREPKLPSAGEMAWMRKSPAAGSPNPGLACRELAYSLLFDPYAATEALKVVMDLT